MWKTWDADFKEPRVKKILTFAFVLLTLSGAFSQIKDNTGGSNPYLNLSQEEKDRKLVEICNERYEESKLRRAEIIARFLIAAGANPDAMDNGAPVLIKNIYYKDGQLAEVLLEGGANPNCTRDGETNPAIWYAIQEKNYKATRMLMDAGADLSWVDEDGRSVIYLMVCKKFPLEEVEYALERGAPAFVKKAPGYEPILEAICKKDLELIKLLERHGASLKTTNDVHEKSALARAVIWRSPEIIQYCIERGCKPSDAGKDAPPLSFYAIRLGDFEVAEYLLKHGDDINKPFFLYGNSYKTHVLQGLLQSKEYDRGYKVYPSGTIRKVLELGADPYLKDEKGDNAFQLAVKLLVKRPSQSSNFLELLQCGYELHPNPKYRKSLGEAIACGDVEAVRKILKTYKVDENSRDLLELGFVGRLENSMETMQLLLDAGIRPDYETIYDGLLQKVSSSRSSSSSKSYGTEYSEKLCSYVDLINGDGKWNHDFVSYCFIKHSIYYNENALKGCINLALDGGMTFDTMIYNDRNGYPEELPLLFYVVINDRSQKCSGIQALVDRGADLNQEWNGKRPIDYLQAGYKNHDFLLDHGVKN